MADTFLESDLTLDITKALNAVGKLDEALHRATTSVVVTADARAVTTAINAALQAADLDVQILGEASDLTSAITAAVETADSNVIVTGDAAELTGEVTSSIEAADSEVVVTGDASELTGDVTAAIDAGDSNVIVTGDATELTGDVTAAVDAGDSNVVITADTTAAQAQISGLGDAADQASGSTSRLGQALAGIGAAAIAKGLFDAAQAASDLGESTSKATAVFGDLTPEVVKFGQQAAVNIGLSEQAALEAAGTFGNLFQALGATQEVSAGLSPQILTLAADLASFNNLNIDVVLEKLRSGLIGEIEPLRSIGISFGAAETEAKAFELGLAEVGAEVTDGAKLQARWALITEQSTIAAGDFARTSGGLANQQRILAAEVANATAAAGQELLPTLLSLVSIARDELVPQFSELSATVFPAFASILTDLAPLLGVTLDLVILLAPAIEAVATVIGAIPGPLISTAGALVLFSKGLGAVNALTVGVVPALKLVPSLISGAASGAPQAAAGFGSIATGITSLATSLGALSLPAVAVAAVGAVLFLSWQKAKKEAREFDSGVRALTGSLEVIDGIAQLTTEGISRFAEENAKSSFVLKNQVDDVARLELSFDEVARFAEKGAEGVKEFVLAAERTGEIELEGYEGGLRSVAQAADLTADELEELARTGMVTVDSVIIQTKGNAELIKSMADLAAQTEETAGNQLEAGIASGVLTQAEVDQALALDENGVAINSNVEALNRLEPQIVANALAVERAKTKYQPLIDSYTKTGIAVERLGDAFPDLTREITTLNPAAANSERAFLDLALGMGEAELSEEQMADAALILGTDVGTLTGIVTEASEAMSEFVNAATDQLPTIADAFSATGEDGILSVQDFVTSLTDSTKQIEEFRTNLAILAYAGFSDIAGIIAEQGPVVGGALTKELVTALQTGNIEVLEEVRTATEGFTTEWETTSAFFRDVIGPEFILSSGLLGAGLSNAFGNNLTLGERIRIAAELAKTDLTVAGQAIAVIAATEGADAAQAYGDLLDLDKKTVAEGIKAGQAIAKLDTTEFANAGAGAAFDFTAGFDYYISGQGTKITGEVIDQYGQYIAEGFGSSLGNSSPSKIARQAGVFFVQGFVDGIETSSDQAVAAASQLASDAIKALESEVPSDMVKIESASIIEAAEINPEAFVARLSMTGSGDGVALTVAPGAVVISFSGAVSDQDARRVGTAVLDGIVDAAAQRQIAVDLRANAGVNR